MHRPPPATTPLTQTSPHLSQPQTKPSSEMANIEMTTQAMLMAGKATINLKIISTTSTATEHPGLGDDIIAQVHDVLSEHCTNELPVKAIRAIITKGNEAAADRT